MSAQIIEFPMNRVRPVQQAAVSPRPYRARSENHSVRNLPSPIAIAKAVLGWSLILVISVGLLLGAGKTIQSAQASGSQVASAEKVSFEYVTVMSGDTLWAIAERHAPTRDPRDFISEIIALNNLSDSVVDAGMRIALPVN